MRHPTRLVALLLLVLVFDGCRLFTREVACERDRDCPKDAGLDYCTSWDGGLGTCVDDEEFRGDFPPDEDEPDAGAVDAG